VLSLFWGRHSDGSTASLALVFPLSASYCLPLSNMRVRLTAFLSHIHRKAGGGLGDVVLDARGVSNPLRQSHWT